MVSRGDDAQLDALRERLRGVRRLLVLSGAGMSAESGIPTFRDALTGLWSRFDPAQLASVEGFRADPALVWDWYTERRLALRGVQPNAGHLALAEFARRRPGVLTIASQNVDDLHQRAGNADTIRLHGELLADRWLERCTRSPVCDTGEAETGRPPRCSRCGNLVRPAVVWFGEMLPAAALEAAEQVARSCEVALIVGTSGAVWPAAGLATLARRSGAHVVIVNPHDSEIDDQAHVVLRATAAQALPRLLHGD